MATNKEARKVAYASYTPKGDYALVLRKRAGKYVKQLREAAELTQLQLAERVGIKYFTFVSQVELGKARVPPESYHKWAPALNVPVWEFARKLLSYYDPYTHAALFSEFPATPKGEAPTVLIDGKTMDELLAEDEQEASSKP